MGGHRGYNICSWLLSGRTQICGKSCREEYCKYHRLKIRQGSKIPSPCLSCGAGVRSEIQLCRDCGRETERYRLKKNISRRQLPSPCLCCGVGTVSLNELCARCEEKYDVEYKWNVAVWLFAARKPYLNKHQALTNGTWKKGCYESRG